MVATIFRSIVLIILTVFSCFVIIWIIVYLQTYINGLFIPYELRWENGKLRQDQSTWLTAGMAIGLIEWSGLVWFSYRLTRWYSKELPISSQEWVVKLSTAIVACTTGSILLYFYSQTISKYF